MDLRTRSRRLSERSRRRVPRLRRDHPQSDLYRTERPEFDHTGTIIERAIVEDDGSRPFELGVIEKTRATTPFRGQAWRRRYEIATAELSPALVVRKPELVKGK